MVIVLVVDSFADKSNGTSMTAARFAHALQKAGHSVRVVAPHVQGDGFYAVKTRYIPIVSEFSRPQHMVFGKPDRAVLERAFAGADVVHLFLPFKLEQVAIKVAESMRIPYMAAFHLQPEHVTYNIGLQHFAPLNRFIFWLFHRWFYRHIRHIHCPSMLIKDELERAGFSGKKYVISNGFDPRFKALESSDCSGDAGALDSSALASGNALDSGSSLDSGAESSGEIADSAPIHNAPIHITMVGRYSPEKRQDLLINAIAQNPYRERIHLHLKGIGPRESRLKKLAKILPNAVDFGFLPPHELVKLLQKSTLYIHTAEVEGEAIACLEAIACGVVPIIADSKVSATSQFALDSRSLFRAGDVQDLSDKISYWITHERERKEQGARYAKAAQNYTLESSIAKAIAMYEEVIADFASYYSNNASNTFGKSQ